MNRSANVNAVSDLTRFRRQLRRYQMALAQTHELLQLEVQRVLDWLEHECADYWLRQRKRAEVKLAEARANYSNCMQRTRPDQPRSCFSEKKVLDRRRQRLREVDERLRRLREFQRRMHHETEKFRLQLRRLSVVAEDDLPRAIASLRRIERYLAKYIRTRLPVTSSRHAAGGQLGHERESQHLGKTDRLTNDSETREEG